VSCQIDLYFEQHQAGVWAPLWQPKPHPNHWWKLIAAPLDAGTASAGDGATGRAERDAAFAAMSLTTAAAVYGDDPDLLLDWPMPEPLVITARDEAWFAALGAGEGGEGQLWPARGLPQDLSPWLAREAEAGADGHSHSWLLVEEILARPELAGLAQVRWLRQHIPAPGRTRMVFWSHV
jgi:hypothetical protein